MASHVRQRLADDAVARVLERDGQLLIGCDCKLHLEAAETEAVSEMIESGEEAQVGEIGHAQIVDDDAHVTDRAADAARQLIEQRHGCIRVVGDERAGPVGLERHRGEGRAEPVVQLATEA